MDRGKRNNSIHLKLPEHMKNNMTQNIMNSLPFKFSHNLIEDNCSLQDDTTNKNENKIEKEENQNYYESLERDLKEYERKKALLKKNNEYVKDPSTDIRQHVKRDFVKINSKENKEHLLNNNNNKVFTFSKKSSKEKKRETERNNNKNYSYKDSRIDEHEEINKKKNVECLNSYSEMDNSIVEHMESSRELMKKKNLNKELEHLLNINNFVSTGSGKPKQKRKEKNKEETEEQQTQLQDVMELSLFDSFNIENSTFLPKKWKESIKETEGIKNKKNKKTHSEEGNRFPLNKSEKGRPLHLKELNSIREIPEEEEVTDSDKGSSSYKEQDSSRNLFLTEENSHKYIEERYKNKDFKCNTREKKEESSLLFQSTNLQNSTASDISLFDSFKDIYNDYGRKMKLIDYNKILNKSLYKNVEDIENFSKGKKKNKQKKKKKKTNGKQGNAKTSEKDVKEIIKNIKKRLGFDSQEESGSEGKRINHHPFLLESENIQESIPINNENKNMLSDNDDDDNNNNNNNNNREKQCENHQTIHDQILSFSENNSGSNIFEKEREEFLTDRNESMLLKYSKNSNLLNYSSFISDDFNLTLDQFGTSSLTPKQETQIEIQKETIMKEEEENEKEEEEKEEYHQSELDKEDDPNKSDKDSLNLSMSTITFKKSFQKALKWSEENKLSDTENTNDNDTTNNNENDNDTEKIEFLEKNNINNNDSTEINKNENEPNEMKCICNYIEKYKMINLILENKNLNFDTADEIVYNTYLKNLKELIENKLNTNENSFLRENEETIKMGNYTEQTDKFIQTIFENQIEYLNNMVTQIFS